MAEFVYERTLDGWSTEELGDVQDFGHFDLVVFGPEDPLTVQVEDGNQEVWGEAAILMENDQGFVYVTYFNTVAEAEAKWAKLEAEYDEFMEGVDDEYY